jgi:hypothetical protein
MTDLLVRSYKLVVSPITEHVSPTVDLQEAIDLSALDIRFKVKKTLKPKPNTAVIRVWGLDAVTRAYFSFPKKLAVSLEVGYGGENELIFLGECRNSFSEVEGPENVTTIETGDSEKVMSAAGLRLTWGQSTVTIQHAFDAIRTTIPQILSGSQTKQWADANAVLGKLQYQVLHPKPGAIDRHSIRFLNDICRSAGLEWSVQNGALYLIPRGQPMAGKEILLSSDPNTGLVGSPSVDNKGFLDVKSLIMPGLRPGARIRVEATNVRGDYRIESVEYEGDSAPGERTWYAKMVCSKLG